MEAPSHSRKLSVAVVLLLLTVAAEMGSAQAKECLSPSTTFRSICLSSKKCSDACLRENSAYSGGKCRGLGLTCYCITPCATTLLAPAALPPSTDQSGGNGFKNE